MIDRYDVRDIVELIEDFVSITFYICSMAILCCLAVAIWGGALYGLWRLIHG